MAAWKNVIAVIFDFDDTLTDDSTSALLAQNKIDLEKFWKSNVMVYAGNLV
jgi:FMN phosphatase YigB (HAD superfamily)